MGLLDWLTDIGSTIGSQSPEAATQRPPGMPPVQQTGADGQPLPPMAVGNTPVAPGAPAFNPAPTPPPMAVGNTPVAPGAPPPMTAQPPIQPGGGLPPGPMPPQAPLPPNAAPTAGGPPMAMNDTPNTTFTPNNPAAPGMPTNPGQGRGFLGQAFGMNSADEKNTLGSLSAGLKSVGDNWNKPGLAAFAGSAGSAIQGGTATEDKRIDQMLKLVQAKQKAGDDSSATSLAAVRLETAKMHLQALKEGNGKGKAWNKPPQQLYQDAMTDAAKDRDVIASQKALEQIIKNYPPGSPELVKAQTDHSALIEAVKDKHLMGVGLNPQSAAGMAKQPGLTAENPVPQAAFANKPFDQVLKPQPYDQYFVDEKGQPRVLKATKSSEAPKTALDAQASIPQSPADAADEEE